MLNKSLTEAFIFCVLNIIGFTTKSCKFFFKPNCQSLAYFTSINTRHRLVSSLLFRNQFLALAVNDFIWIIVGSFILTKLLAYTFFLKDISPILIHGSFSRVKLEFLRNSSTIYRSSHRSYLIQKTVLKSLAILTEIF